MDKRSMSLCISTDWCDGYNTAVEEANKEIKELKNRLKDAETDLASLIWYDGNCDYCKYAKEEKYANAIKFVCTLDDCKPQWKGVDDYD